MRKELRDRPPVQLEQSRFGRGPVVSGELSGIIDSVDTGVAQGAGSMNVLHVTLSFSNGGRREAIAELCRRLVPLGVTSHLCCLEAFDSSEAEREACFADAIELRRRRMLDWHALGRLRAYCAANAIDVVHTHDAASEATSALALPHHRLPILMTFHRTRDFESARPRDRLRNALAGLRVAAVVTASEARRRHYLDRNFIRAAKVRCIPLGIDLDRFHPNADRRASKRTELGIGKGQILIGTVGHFGLEKGVDLAVDAFQIFCEENPDSGVHLVVLGTGSDELEQFVRSRVADRFADRIRFVGYQSSPEEWLPAFDLLLHGARNEAFGLVLAEAMACAVPVVAARVGGVPEVVDDGMSGILADAAEATALASALARALLTPGWRSAASAHALARARLEFRGERYARRYFDLYVALMDQN